MNNLSVQEELFGAASAPPADGLTARSGSFVDNMKLPIHRWFRYSAGFSAEWAQQVIRESGAKRVLDPFAGSGTTLLAADVLGVPSLGIEAHPFVVRLGAAKSHWDQDVSEFQSCAAQVLDLARSCDQIVHELQEAPVLLAKCYEPSSLGQLYALRTAFATIEVQFSENVKSLIFLAITAILRECSHVGTAQWQYVLPNKRKKKVLVPFDAFEAKIRMFTEDMIYMQQRVQTGRSVLVRGDARNIHFHAESEAEFDLLLTSPPYPNNYDYADATRLEMTFWEEVGSWGDLHDAVRKYLVRSSSQHTAKEKLVLKNLLSDSNLEPISEELTRVCTELAEVRETKGGKKTYHTMVAAYFSDMAAVLASARKVMRSGGEMCFVIGDSAPYGVYVPADVWFSKLALNAGFKSSHFEKIRDRNVKWKNRKHTVPLNEGRLWISC